VPDFTYCNSGIQRLDELWENDRLRVTNDSGYLPKLFSSATV
jgi:hypothetical protein